MNSSSISLIIIIIVIIPGASVLVREVEEDRAALEDLDAAVVREVGDLAYYDIL